MGYSFSFPWEVTVNRTFIRQPDRRKIYQFQGRQKPGQNDITPVGRHNCVLPFECNIKSTFFQRISGKRNPHLPSGARRTVCDYCLCRFRYLPYALSVSG